MGVPRITKVWTVNPRKLGEAGKSGMPARSVMVRNL